MENENENHWACNFNSNINRSLWSVVDGTVLVILVNVRIVILVILRSILFMVIVVILVVILVVMLVVIWEYYKW